jgi:hypothetical protein
MPAMPDASMTAPVGRSRLGRFVWPAVGLGALVGGTALGWDAGLLEAIVAPPALIRAFLVAVSVVGGLALLRAAVVRLEGVAGGERDLPTAIRGIRLAFLAVAAFAAASGWLLAHPLPFIVALVIAGVDILETSFLSLVVTLRRD